MTTGLHIAEVARRSGLPPSTLRYYEQVGLLPPAGRTAAGYRVYEESVLDRLAFIARAKALSCSLEEIAELLPHWMGGQCAPLQGRLRQVGAAKLQETHTRINELEAFADDLRHILAALAGHTPDGPCDDECGCLVDSPAGKRLPSAVGNEAIACTLQASDIPARVREWQAVLGHVTARSERAGGVRLEFDDRTPIEELARLMDAERACCSFFTFTMTLDERGVGLEVRAPAGAQDTLAALFGAY
jgi:MerR family copper efflux transcriptional regulator